MFSITTDTFRIAKNYQDLHSAITLLAYMMTGELEDAKEIASEFLIECWQKLKKGALIKPSASFYDSRIYALFHLLQNETQLRRLGENQFVKNSVISQSAYEQFRVADRTTILRWSVKLDPLEQYVIRSLIWEELSIEEISVYTGKSIPAIKIIQDRAVYKLKKIASQLFINDSQ